MAAGDDLLGGAADDQIEGQRMAVGADDHEVGPDVVGDGKELFSRTAEANSCFDDQVCLPKRSGAAAQEILKHLAISVRQTPERVAFQVAVLSALSDPIRLRSLALIAKDQELCVCELTHALGASQPTISKHLAILREAGLVKDRRNAQWVFYSLTGDLPAWSARVLAAAVEGVSVTAGHAEDVERLKGMTPRPPRTLVA